jgi:hypothetical protein
MPDIRDRSWKIALDLNNYFGLLHRFSLEGSQSATSKLFGTLIGSAFAASPSTEIPQKNELLHQTLQFRPKEHGD